MLSQTAKVAAMLLALVTAAPAQEFQPLRMNQGDCETYTGVWFCPKFKAVTDLVPELMTVRYATADSVTGGAAIRVDVKKGSTGAIGYETEEFTTKDAAGKDVKATTLMSGSAGLTFYAKASRPVDIQVSGRATVSLGPEWKKYDIAWKDLNTTADKPDLGGEVVLALAAPATADCSLFYDRIGTEKTFSQPVAAPQGGTDKAINTEDIVGNAQVLEGMRGRLKARKPVRIYVIGDSVSAGAQSHRGSPSVGAKLDDYLYYNHLARLLRARYGYEEVTAIAKAKGGRAASDAVKIMPELFGDLQADDVLIIELGTNDLNRAIEDHPATAPERVNGVKIWLNHMRTLVAEGRKKTTQIIIVTPTAGPMTLEFAKQASAEARKFAEQEKVAYIDVLGWSDYRGHGLAYGYLANFFHPDITGHITIGRIAATLFTGENFDWPPYAAKPASSPTK